MTLLLGNDSLLILLSSLESYILFRHSQSWLVSLFFFFVSFLLYLFFEQSLELSK